MNTTKRNTFFLCILAASFTLFTACSRVPVQTEFTITQLESLPEGSWQGEVSFPDWKGYVDDTLAMNSMYSFDGAPDQGKMYLTVDENVESYDLFLNNEKIDTSHMKNGVYELDYSEAAVSGTNTIQVTNIVPDDLEQAVNICIPYPSVIDGSPAEAGIHEAPLRMISSIIMMLI